MGRLNCKKWLKSKTLRIALVRFRPEVTIAKVPDAGNDIKLVVDLFVERWRHNLNLILKIKKLKFIKNINNKK